MTDLTELYTWTCSKCNDLIQVRYPTLWCLISFILITIKIDFVMGACFPKTGVRDETSNRWCPELLAGLYLNANTVLQYSSHQSYLNKMLLHDIKQYDRHLLVSITISTLSLFQSGELKRTGSEITLHNFLVLSGFYGSYDIPLYSCLNFLLSVQNWIKDMLWKQSDLIYPDMPDAKVFATDLLM